MKETALLIGVQQRAQTAWEVSDSLDELDQLACTADAVVVDRYVFKQEKPHPGLFIGRGKAEQIAARVEADEVNTVIFDDDLTPAQGRNLEAIIKTKVLDRTQLILDIFAARAATSEGRLQVELAQLRYTMPRLRRMWTHLERQKGGIGLRGPGEQQIEVDRRRIEQRIDRLSAELEHVRTRRAEQRKGRRRHGWALVSLVGYTNAGKSTLLNRLSEAHVFAHDQLFATLDPTTRQIRLPNHQPALLTDTVGFIRKLPHGLVESFKATLEEVAEADLLLHVIDASHPQVERQIEAVEQVLEEIGAGQKPTLMVLNKIDLPEGRNRARALERDLPHSVVLSARSGEGIDRLEAALADALRHRNVAVLLRVPHAEGKLLSQLTSAANILERTYVDDIVEIRARVPVHLLGPCRPYIVPDPEAPVPPEDEEAERSHP